MKKSRLFGALFAALVSCFTISAHAALVNNCEGLVYDDVLSITWAQPNSTARNWDDSNTYASGLELGGVSEWRLAYISVAAGAGPLDFNGEVNCSAATELACRDNELGYMFYHNLGGTSGQSILLTGDPEQLALFPSLTTFNYWSGTARNDTTAHDFVFGTGSNEVRNKTQSL